MSCKAKERHLCSALHFLRANKEANVAVEASYVVRVMIAGKTESNLLKAGLKEMHACKSQMLSVQKKANAAVSLAHTGDERLLGCVTNLKLYVHKLTLDEVSDKNIICQQLLDIRAPDAI